MNLEKYFKQFEKRAKNPTLEAMIWLMKELGNPQEKIKMIHIAGTNGKGSVCEMLNSVLVKANYKVGKYMSPHLIKMNERITINGVSISDKKIEKLLEKLDPKIQEYNETHKTKVTWFEAITGLAFLYFYQENCDIAIIETGLGGLYDSTNIIHPIVSIITTIAYDHMHILGSTLEAIAKQKAGIIKRNSHTVFLDQSEVISVIQEECDQKGNQLHLVKSDEIHIRELTKEFQIFDYQEYYSICVNLKGNQQITNACMVIETMKILKEEGFEITESAIKDGLKTVIHKGRFEIINENPTIIFDGGHNENAIQNLKNTIQRQYPDQKKVFIFSILQTKDYATVLKELLEDQESIFIMTSGNQEGKFVNQEILYQEASRYRRHNLYAFDLKEAIHLAKRNYSNSIIFIIGSFYVYQNVLEEVHRREE